MGNDLYNRIEELRRTIHLHIEELKTIYTQIDKLKTIYTCIKQTMALSMVPFRWPVSKKMSLHGLHGLHGCDHRPYHDDQNNSIFDFLECNNESINPNCLIRS